MSMKRRVVYLSDEQWEALHRQARAERVTISALIRDRALSVAGDVPRDAGFSVPNLHVFDVQPVTFTPVPKPGKRR